MHTVCFQVFGVVCFALYRNGSLTFDKNGHTILWLPCIVRFRLLTTPLIFIMRLLLHDSYGVIIRMDNFAVNNYDITISKVMILFRLSFFRSISFQRKALALFEQRRDLKVGKLLRFIFKKSANRESKCGQVAHRNEDTKRVQ